MERHRSFFLAAALGLSAFALAGCDVQPKNVPCSNAGDCAGDPRFAYCLQSRCVECLSSASCGDGNLCHDGMCERHCRDARDCPAGQACSHDECRPL